MSWRDVTQLHSPHVDLLNNRCHMIQWIRRLFGKDEWASAPVVDLYVAYSWDCPRCAKKSYCDGVDAEFGDGQELTVEDQTYSGEELQEFVEECGGIVYKPHSAKCQHCKLRVINVES